MAVIALSGKRRESLGKGSARKARQSGLQHAGAIVLHHADAQRRMHLRCGHVGYGLVVQRKQPPRMAEQPRARFGRLDAVHASMQQRDAERAFQLADLHADRRLRAVQRARRARERTVLDDRDIRAQQFGIQQQCSHDET